VVSGDRDPLFCEAPLILCEHDIPAHEAFVPNDSTVVWLGVALQGNPAQMPARGGLITRFRTNLGAMLAPTEISVCKDQG
jgi:hypothetical protein